MGSKILIGSFVTLLLISFCACQNPKESQNEFSAEDLKTKIQAAVDSDSVQAFFYSLYDSIQYEGNKSKSVSQTWNYLTDIYIDKNYPEEAEKSLIQSLRIDKDQNGIDTMIFKVAESLDLGTNRGLISKTYYRLLTDNYPKSTKAKIAADNLPSDMKALQMQIKDAEEKVRNFVLSDSDLPSKLIKDYVSLAQLHAIFVGDTSSTDYLLKAAAVARGYGNEKMANLLYSWIESDFPNSENAPKALFERAFMWDQLKNVELSETLYQRFIRKYKSHKLNSQVKMLLENVNLSDEEILKRLEQNSE
jgi:hypothetical protein